MSRRCALIGVEGNHDQAFLERILKKLLAFKRFDGEQEKLEEPLWKKFIPTYPGTRKLYTRLDMPSILFNENLSVAICVGGGKDKLVQNLQDRFSNIDCSQLFAFGIVGDADKNPIEATTKKYHDSFQEYFAKFPQQVSKTGIVVEESSPRLGMYILPDNLKQGVLDTLLCKCGDVAYPKYMERAREYIGKFSEEETKRLEWKPFDKEKAIIATVVSVLKPGKTNTASIADDKWINSETESQIPELKNLTNFLKKLLDLPRQF